MKLPSHEHPSKGTERVANALHRAGASLSRGPGGAMLRSGPGERVRRRVYRSSFDLLAAVADVLDAEGVRWWVGGGWGIDVLVGRELRSHDDIDVGVDWRDDGEQRATAALGALGYRVTVLRAESGAQFPDRAVLRRPDGRIVDLIVVHELGVDDRRPPEGVAVLDQDQIATGRLHGRSFRCLSPARQLVAHQGYPLDRRARNDILELCRTTGLPVPGFVGNPPPQRLGGRWHESLSRVVHGAGETALVAPLAGLDDAGVHVDWDFDEVIGAGVVVRRPFVPAPRLEDQALEDLAELVARRAAHELVVGDPQCMPGLAALSLHDPVILRSLSEDTTTRWPIDGPAGEHHDPIGVVFATATSTGLPLGFPLTVRVEEVVLCARGRRGRWQVLRRFPLGRDTGDASPDGDRAAHDHAPA